jgi:hypothetical protein
MEKYIWSLDVSTTNIGSALWDEKGKLIELKHLALKTDKETSVENRSIYKAEIFRKYIEEYKERVLNELNGEIIHIVVEKPLGGSNNSNTVSMLYEFNGICSYILYKVFNIYPKKINVYDSRKLFFINLVHTSNKKNKKTGEMETIETLSFPPEYRDEKKLYIWKKVAKLEKEIEWFYKKDGTPKDMNFDMADSFVVGIAGLITLGIITKEMWKKRYLSI